MANDSDFKRAMRSLASDEILIPTLHAALYSPDFKGFQVPVDPWEDRPYDGKFHPSTHSTWTVRQLYVYLVAHLMLVPDPFELTGVLAVTAGSFWHRFLQQILLESAMVVRQRPDGEPIHPAEVVIDDPEHNRAGHADGQLVNGEGLEIKTINNYQVEKVVSEAVLKEKKLTYWCLPTDITEVLTPTGWQPLTQIEVGDLVASWDPDTKQIRMRPALGKVKPYLADTVSVGDIEMTADHRVYLSTPQGIEVRTVAECASIREDQKVYLPTCGESLEAAGLGIEPDLLRLLVWTQADGSYKRLAKDGSVYGLRFHFAKQRKVDRVIELLTRLQAPFSVTKTKSGNTTSIYVSGKQWMDENILCWLDEKRFDWRLLRMSNEEFAAFEEELFQADGYVNQTKGLAAPPCEYYSSIRQNADVVQALLVLHGSSARLFGHNGYRVYRHSRRSQGRLVGGSYVADVRQSVEVSCLTTVDGTLLVRQDGQVRIVGNCQTQDYLDVLGLEVMRYLMLNPDYPFKMKEFVVRRNPHYIAQRRFEYKQAVELAERYPDVRELENPLTEIPACCAPKSQQAKTCPARNVCPIGRMK